jgi:hypothetical protein
MERELRILILEDEPNDAELVERELRKAGMSFTPKRVETREDFFEAIKNFGPDFCKKTFRFTTMVKEIETSNFRSAWGQPLVIPDLLVSLMNCSGGLINLCTSRNG